MWRSGWIPATATAVLGAIVLHLFGVDALSVAGYFAYLAAAVVLPGTLIWRALRRRSGLLVEDLAGGAAVGCAVTIAAHLVAVAAGIPAGSVVVALAIVAVFAAIPRLRPCFRGSGERVPPGFAWTVSAFLIFAIGWSGIAFYRTVGLSFPGNSSPYPDLLYQMALTGELKNHLPPSTPYVNGEPLRYHWFFHASTAASGSVTGIETEVLIYRLAALPAFALLLVALALVARKIVGVWWAGPAALAITLFAVRPGEVGGSGFLLPNVWNSPTQTFGSALFACAMLLLVDAVRAQASGGDIVLLGVILTATAGAKATFLPMLLCGLLLIAMVQLATREPVRRVLAVAGLTLAILAVMTLVLYSGTSLGLEIAPLQTLRSARHSIPANFAIHLLGWMLAWAGLAGLLVAPARLRDPAVLLCLGLGIAGLAAYLLTTQPGGSQGYFVQSGRPYLAIAAVAGLAALLQPGRLAGWRTAAAGVLAVVMAATMISIPDYYRKPVQQAMDQGLRAYPRQAGQVAEGAQEMGRWLRENSSPDDLVATNVHCRVVLQPGMCDYRSFWVSAYAERRVLLEGWAYAPRSYGGPSAVRYTSRPFWNPHLLAANDAAFLQPSPATLAVLRDVYGVRWLVADERLATGDLSALVPLRFRSGEVAVYELPPA